jgi:hypothetical protein
MGRKEGRYQQELGFAQAAKEAAVQNIAGGISAIGGAGMALANPLGKTKTPDVPIKAKGGKIEKTPGKFSHKDNPINLMKDGAKIGEMTGGEYIFNPTQMSNIKKFTSAGDKEKLHSYVRSLIKKFEK